MIVITKRKEIHALTHPAEREPVRARERLAPSDDHERLLASLAAESLTADEDHP